MNDETFMAMALDQARDALASDEFPVGCVITLGGKVVATGRRSGTRADDVNEIDHAEISALRNLPGRSTDCDRKDMTLYCTMEPCLMCYAAIMLSGIGRVVYAYEDAMGGGTRCDLSTLPPLYGETGIVVIPGVLRSEALGLFKQFFLNPENAYWKGSLLEQYTLSAS